MPPRRPEPYYWIRSKAVAAKIYTRKGDDGTTSLWYGGRVQKNDPRTEAYGALDEAGSALGVARSLCKDERLHADILRLQEELFVAGAELATAPEARERLEAGVQPWMTAWSTGWSWQSTVTWRRSTCLPSSSSPAVLSFGAARRRARGAATRRAEDRGPGARGRAGGLGRSAPRQQGLRPRVGDVAFADEPDPHLFEGRARSRGEPN